MTENRRVLVWRGTDEFRAEYAEVELFADRLTARGVQIGVDPEPYEARYALETRAGFETSRLTVDVSAEGVERRLELSSEDRGWPAGAIDCDLAFSPLTNAMPIMRDRLHEGGEARDYEMAWVSLPDLAVHRSPQRYEPIAPGRVRFVSRDSDFRAELEVDDDGLLRRYEYLAERVTP